MLPCSPDSWIRRLPSGKNIFNCSVPQRYISKPCNSAINPNLKYATPRPPHSDGQQHACGGTRDHAARPAVAIPTKPGLRRGLRGRATATATPLRRKQRLSVKRDEDIDKEPTYALSCRCGTFKWTIPKLPARARTVEVPQPPPKPSLAFPRRTRFTRAAGRDGPDAWCDILSQGVRARRSNRRPRIWPTPRRVGGGARRSETEHRRRRRGPRAPTRTKTAAAGDELFSGARRICRPTPG